MAHLSGESMHTTSASVSLSTNDECVKHRYYLCNKQMNCNDVKYLPYDCDGDSLSVSQIQSGSFHIFAIIVMTDLIR